MSDRRGTFVERVLDGEARVGDLEEEVQAWLAGPRRRPLDAVLGLTPAELDLVAATPDALRYVLHSRRFGRRLAAEELVGQRRVRLHSMRIVAEAGAADPHELAELEAWEPHVVRSSAAEHAHA